VCGRQVGVLTGGGWRHLQTTYFDVFVTQHGVQPGDDETFLNQVLLGHIRYAKLLRVFVDEFYGQNSGTLLRGDATLYGILALLTLIRLEEVGFAAFRKIVLSQDPQKMIVFLQYSFDIPLLQKLLLGEWTRIYDRERVKAIFTSLKRFLAPTGDLVSALEEKVFLRKKKEEEEANAWASEGAATYTTAVPFQLSESRPRIIRVHTAPTTSPVRVKAIPKSLYKSTKDILAEFEKQRRDISSSWSGQGFAAEGAASGALDDDAAPSPRTMRTAPSLSFAKGTRTPSSARHRACGPPDTEFRPFQAIAVPQRPCQAASVHFNSALVQREKQRAETQRCADLAKQRRFEQEKRDSSAFDMWRTEMLRNDEKQRLSEIQRRREEMADTAEQSTEAFKHMIDQRIARAGKFKSEEQALLRTMEADVREMRAYKKGQHDAVRLWEDDSRKRKEAHQRRKEERAGTIRSWREVGRQSVERDRAEQLEDKRSKVKDVKEERVEALRVLYEKYEKHGPSLEVVHVGMLDEMTTEELREGLKLAPALRQTRTQEGRQSILRSKNRQAAMLLNGAKSVGELRSGAQATTPRRLMVAKSGALVKTATSSRSRGLDWPRKDATQGGWGLRDCDRGSEVDEGAKEKADPAKRNVEVKRFRSLRSGAQRELRQRQAQSQQETLVYEKIRVAEGRERQLHLQQQKSQREKENRRFFEVLKRRGLEQTEQAIRDRESRRSKAQAQRAALRIKARAV